MLSDRDTTNTNNWYVRQACMARLPIRYMRILMNHDWIINHSERLKLPGWYCWTYSNSYIDVCDILADNCERFAKKISCVLAFDVLNVTCCKEFPNLLLIIRKKNIKPPTVSDMCVFYPSLSLLRFHCVFLTIRFLCFPNRLQLLRYFPCSLKSHRSWLHVPTYFGSEILWVTISALS